MADVVEKMLGKKEAKHDSRNLLAAKYLASSFPASYDWQRYRRPVPARTYGNTVYGDCTLASQANLVSRFERTEQRRTILLPDQLVVDNYLQMTGGADEGWEELGALKRWRTVGYAPQADHTYTIDAFTQINQSNVDEMKAALWQFKLIKVCFGLPWAWSKIGCAGYDDPASVGAWDVGDGPDFEFNSWGGHSMSADAYDSEGLWVIHSWYEGTVPARQKVTWEAVKQYSDEAYSVVDSFDVWRKRRTAAFNLPALASDVREVTS